jgi:hypothetical protein
MVEGSCCAPEAVAAGACKPFRLSECTGGKVKRGEFCVCPQGTSENKDTGACDKPSPLAEGATPSRTPLGAPPPGGACLRAAGGQCCAPFEGATLCTPAPASGACPGSSVCCSEEQRAKGTCLAQPPVTLIEPPTPPPTVTATTGAPVCPFTQRGNTCCSPTNVPLSCTTRSPSAACESSEVALDFRGVSACCKPEPGGSCTEDISATPPPGSRPRPPERNPLCDIPYIELLLCPPAPAGSCSSDSECPTGSRCRDGACFETGAPAALSVPAECTGGKVKRGEFCVCPQGTSENKRTGACDKPPPVAKKKKDAACKPGFERRGRRCVRSGGTVTEGGQGGPAKGTGTRSSGGEKVTKPRGRSPLMGDGLLDPGIGGGGGGTPTISGGGAPASGGGGGGAPRSGGFRPR